MTNANESAFVIDGQYAADAMRNGTSGLTKREYFAAMAMQGLIQNQENTIGDISLGAVRVADALIEALNKKEATHA